MISLKNKELQSTVLLVLAALIWGFAFVAQRVGMQYIGAFTFNGVRFILGAASLMPLIYLTDRRKKKTEAAAALEPLQSAGVNRNSTLPIIKAGAIAGSVLFFGAALQQVGLAETTAGKAAFITGFYIILVPIFGLFLKQKAGKGTWISAVFAVIGLYLISVSEDAGISRGDLLEFVGSFFWTAHILLISWFTQKVDILKLSFVQYVVCAALSMTAAFLFEEIQLSSFVQAAIPILYGGVASVGIAYTLQAYGQKYAKPSHAAIILSLEAVFAVLGGFLILGETMTLRGYIGCALMFAGVLLSQRGQA
jgi:drug/metabolite transporter (DMT)-like permease